MTNKIERLRELVRRADSSEHYWQQQASAMEFAAHGDWLLDRLDAVVEAAKLAVAYADEAWIGYENLKDALAELEDKK